ncbi:hypothetical protein MMC08_004932 [Hypocenomyce scalaris]|nr:hypothetical protein [Hypocenomyce scalaris]
MHLPFSRMILPVLSASTLVHSAAIEATRTVSPPPNANGLESRALPNATCPDFTKIVPPEQYLGPTSNGKCSWQETLICGSLLVGCPTGCIAAALEVGLNPFATTECVACLGITGGNCALCIFGTNTAEVCNAVYWEPEASCLLSLCNNTMIAQAKAHPPAALMEKLLSGAVASSVAATA